MIVHIFRVRCTVSVTPVTLHCVILFTRILFTCLHCTLQALRMVEDSVDGFGDFPPHFQPHDYTDKSKLDAALEQPNDQRVFAIAHAMQTGYSIDQIHVCVVAGHILRRVIFCRVYIFQLWLVFGFELCF